MNIRARRRTAGSEQGSALIEVAVTMPILVIMVIGLMRFGIAYNNSIVLTDSVRAGARQLSISRGVAGDICNAAGVKVRAAATTLTAGTITMTMTVNGTAYTAAAGALPACSGAGTTMTVSSDATVNATYPCSLRAFGITFGPNSCTLTAATTARVE